MEIDPRAPSTPQRHTSGTTLWRRQAADSEDSEEDDDGDGDEGNRDGAIDDDDDDDEGSDDEDAYNEDDVVLDEGEDLVVTENELAAHPLFRPITIHVRRYAVDEVFLDTLLAKMPVLRASQAVTRLVQQMQTKFQSSIDLEARDHARLRAFGVMGGTDADPGSPGRAAPTNKVRWGAPRPRPRQGVEQEQERYGWG